MHVSLREKVLFSRQVCTKLCILFMSTQKFFAFLGNNRTPLQTVLNPPGGALLESIR